MSDMSATCPRCARDVVAVRRGEWTIKAAMLKRQPDGSVLARCATPGCTEEIPLPMLTWAMPGSGRAPPRRRLVAGPRVDSKPET